jgi:hypothetical protein
MADVEARLQLKPAYTRCINWSKEHTSGAVGNLEDVNSILKMATAFQSQQHMPLADLNVREEDFVILCLREKPDAEKTKLDACKEKPGETCIPSSIFLEGTDKGSGRSTESGNPRRGRRVSKQ